MPGKNNPTCFKCAKIVDISIIVCPDCRTPIIMIPEVPLTPGIMVKKVNSELKDNHPDGTFGMLVGVLGKPENDPPIYGYIVDFPLGRTFAMPGKIEPLTQ